MIKVGSTARPIARLWQLRFGGAGDYAPDDRTFGRYVYLEPLETKAQARAAETTAHRILKPYRIRTMKSARSAYHFSKVEWYDVDQAVATRALQVAAAFAENLLVLSVEELREIAGLL